ncbi:MAG: porin [Pseudohongiellaceae bacterium]
MLPSWTNKRHLAAFLLQAILITCSASAFAAEQKEEAFPNLGRLVSASGNPWLQEFWALGRYHAQYHTGNGDTADSEGLEHRRLRLGFQARMFQKLTLHAQAVSGTDLDPLYNGFTELWAGWRFNDALILTVGQQKHRFTHDRNVSSRYINYLERGMLTNMFALDYTPAVTLSGTVKDWTYYTGVFSNATGRNMRKAFTENKSGTSFMISATRDLHGALGMDTAHLNVAWLRSDAKPDATNMNQFDTGLNTALIMTKGSRALVAELTAGHDSSSGAAIGLNLQPSWFITRKVQLVGRYQLAFSDSPAGLRAQRRYERPAGLDRGDHYQAAYVGADYYLAGHRTKLMAGLEYARMDQREVVTASVAFRMFFGPHSRAPFPAAMLLEPD